MRRTLATACIGLATLVLAGCSLVLPPSAEGIAGSYAADDAIVVVNEDGTCAVSNFPDDVGHDAEGHPVFGPERFNADCTWELGRLLVSGAWELNVVTSPGGDNLYLDWNNRNWPFDETGCLSRTLGDLDMADFWNLCPLES